MSRRKRTPLTNQEIQVTHNGIVIRYEELPNRWEFELRGEERHAESLQAAKVMIDKPAPKEKAPFEPFQAWVIGYSVEEVTVTSIAVNRHDWDKDICLWTVSKYGEGKSSRSKHDSSAVFPKNPHNDAVIDNIIHMDNEIEKLTQDREKEKRKLRCFKPKDGGAK